MPPTRRDVLRASGLVAGVGLAGCTGGGDTATPTEEPMDSATPTATETAAGTASPTDSGTPMSTSTTTGSATGGGTTTVAMVNTTFDPVRVRVDAGGTVEWTNEDGYSHDVTAATFHDEAASWDYHETLSGGETTSRTFDSAGVYEYYCSIHGKGTMCGVVLVGDASLDADLPCEDGGGGAY